MCHVGKPEMGLVSEDPSVAKGTTSYQVLPLAKSCHVRNLRWVWLQKAIPSQKAPRLATCKIGMGESLDLFVNSVAFQIPWLLEHCSLPRLYISYVLIVLVQGCQSPRKLCFKTGRYRWIGTRYESHSGSDWLDQQLSTTGFLSNAKQHMWMPKLEAFMTCSNIHDNNFLASCIPLTTSELMLGPNPFSTH